MSRSDLVREENGEHHMSGSIAVLKEENNGVLVKREEKKKDEMVGRSYLKRRDRRG